MCNKKEKQTVYSQEFSELFPSPSSNILSTVMCCYILAYEHVSLLRIPPFMPNHETKHIFRKIYYVVFVLSSIKYM